MAVKKYICGFNAPCGDGIRYIKWDAARQQFCDTSDPEEAYRFSDIKSYDMIFRQFEERSPVELKPLIFRKTRGRLEPELMYEGEMKHERLL